MDEPNPSAHDPNQRAHPVRARSVDAWGTNWTILITLSGWFFLALGLVRMFAASQYLQATQGARSMTFMALEGLLLVVAPNITFKAYSSTTP